MNSLDLPWYTDYAVLLCNGDDSDLIALRAEDLFGPGCIIVELESDIYRDALAYMQGVFLAEDPPKRIDILDLPSWKVRIGEYGVRWIRIVKRPTEGGLN